VHQISLAYQVRTLKIQISFENKESLSPIFFGRGLGISAFVRVWDDGK